MSLGPGNHLLYGDNVTVMRDIMDARSVDLIYLDPPFKSDRNYNLIYSAMTGMPVPEQAEAFCDTWTLNASKAELLDNLSKLLQDAKVDPTYLNFWETWIRALEHTQPHLLAYLYYMVERLLWIKPVLRDTGSIYLHCDPTASHYIKVMMDGIFGHQNFRNEIIWKRTSAHSSAKRYGPIHDTLLFYSKSDKYTWNPINQPYDAEYLEQRFKRGGERPWKDADLTGSGTRNGETGQAWRGFDVTAKGRHWAYPPPVLDKMDAEGFIYWPKKKGGWPRERKFLDDAKGVPLQDVWTDIAPLNSQANERLGYPTQKPKALLKRIIEASSNPGDTIFDPFCGCGTTIYAAQEIGQRRWIGCDIAILAVKIIKNELIERYRLAEDADFHIKGIPVSVESARDLFERDPLQFQHWAVEQIGGFVNSRMSGDRGIDGRIYYQTDSGLRSMVISVKGGKLKATDVRDLIGTVSTEREADMGGLICFDTPSTHMRAAGARVDPYVYRDVKYAGFQFLTVKEILEGKARFQTPTRIGTKKSTGQGSLAFN